ncbi:MAG: S8 family serine peptidase [Thermomicrobiales bacterium]|nr:S8 family serine peptidase [Thermomicrobiales bacterium]
MRRYAPGLIRRSQLALVAVLVAGVFLSLVSPSSASAADLSFPSSDLVIQLRSPQDAAALDGARSVRALDASGTVVVADYASAADAAAATRRLRANSGVLNTAPNVKRYLSWEPSDPDYAQQSEWLQQIRAPQAWDITTGDANDPDRTDPVIVAVIDSGVSPTQPDLVNRLVEGYNAIDGSSNTADMDGHGTHVAGLIAAQGGNDYGTAGVAMDVRIMPIRVVSDDGSIDVALEIAGIYWAVDNGADVINLSLGSDEYVQAERDAVRYARDNGVVVVAAGGNSVSVISYPANYSEAIAVGVVAPDGNPANFTSRVSRIDIAAPGVSLFSPGWDALYGDYWADVFYSNNKPVSGTSFSSAIVSGAAALIKAVQPGIGAEDVRTILTSTASDSGDPGPQAGTGAGLLDLEAALRAAVYGEIQSTWDRTDSVVANGEATRTWLWGDQPQTSEYEAYSDTQHGSRLVYYFDKSRMEITDPLSDRSNPWYVTNGLLVKELISGQMQIGDAAFQPYSPAQVGVAGDPDDDLGPTYASFANLLNGAAAETGTVVDATLARDGTTGIDERYAEYGVVAGPWIDTTSHSVAGVFWDYLNSSGLIATPDGTQEGLLFDPWFYATGYPITEAFWSQVKLKGVYTDVLVQCFERRCLTYTPSNDAEWRVEMGNVGQHYYQWRYGTPLVEAGDASRHTASTGESTFDTALIRRLLRVFD